MNFAIRPLNLPATRRFLVEPRTTAQPNPDPVQPSADETADPVSASFRELTIPDILPPQRASWRRPRHIRGRAS